MAEFGQVKSGALARTRTWIASLGERCSVLLSYEGGFVILNFSLLPTANIPLRKAHKAAILKRTTPLLFYQPMAKSYTGTGDHGTTGRVGGKRQSKASCLTETLGALDETNAAVGLARSFLKKDAAVDAEHKKEIDAMLKALQDTLFRVGADISTPLDHPTPLAPRITNADLKKLEEHIDALDEKLPELTQFILPGGSPAAAGLHLARATMRRAERTIVESKEKGEKLNENLLAYTNRLSSYLFALARFVNFCADTKEEHPKYSVNE